MGNENIKHIYFYDWLRIFATVFVVIGHSAYINMGGTTYELPNGLSASYNSLPLAFLRYLSGWVYQFHMPLFFILSGAVLAIKPIKSFDKVCISKIKRLIFPYFVYGFLFMIPVKYLNNYYNGTNISVAFTSFLSGSNNGHLWFLPALFWCIMVFVIIFKILKRFNVKSLYLLLFISGIIQLYHSSVPFDFFLLQKGLDYIFWFALGYVFETERRSYPSWGIKNLSITIVILLFLEFLNYKYYILNPFFQIVCGSFLTYVIARLFSQLFKNFTTAKIWKIITRNLFNIYLFHDPLEYVILKIFMNNNYLISSFGCYMYVTLRIIGVIVVSILLGEFVRVTKNIYLKKLSSSSIKLDVP